MLKRNKNKTRPSKKGKTKEIQIGTTENRFCYFSKPPPETIRVTGTSLRRSNLWDCLSGQVIVTIG